MPGVQAKRDTKEKGGELSEVEEQAKSWEARLGRGVEEPMQAGQMGIPSSLCPDCRSHCNQAPHGRHTGIQ